MPSKTLPHRVVVLGAGIAGLRVAVELGKRCVRMRGCEITLIDKNSGHVYWPLLYEVCSGALEDSKNECVGELRSGVCIGFEDYVNILRHKHIRFVRGVVSGIDQEKKEVVLADDRRVAYDDVVVALGAESATYGIPGIAEHASTMKSLGEAMKIRERLAKFLSAYRKGTEKHVSVVVGGGGATGTELSGELGNFFHHLVEQKEMKVADYNITLVEAGPSILAPYTEKFRACAMNRLKQLGVEVVTDMKILSVEKNAIRYAGKDGKEASREADVVVWAGGIKPAELVKKLGLPVDEKGFIAIEPTFEVKGMEHAYALGDCAAVMHPKTGRRVPALGQAAEREAAIVAENVVRHLERKGLMNWTPPDHWITVVPIGGKFALADFGKWYIGGMLGYLIRKAADFYYFFSVLPWRNAWSIWMRGAAAYTRNDSGSAKAK